MAYKRISPISVIDGGTGNEFFSEFSVIVGGNGSDCPLQGAPCTTDIGAIFVSNGTDSIPSFTVASGTSSFRFQLLSADPGSPQNGQVWYNTTANLFKGRANGVTYTFDVT